jgi:hypothetical protein
MTGLLDRLRAWFGAVFRRGTAETGDDAPESDASDRRVVHRDDRPLETPSTMDRPAPPSASTPDRPARVEVPDAEADVSMPDAEAPTEPTDHDGGAGTPAADDRETDGAVDTDVTDAAVACSVCGTTVDDPSAPCPLCRSTDVVPVADTPDGMAGETPAHGRRTAVSTADDDAVERLRDVREAE